jgi:hypothetical protein
MPAIVMKGHAHDKVSSGNFPPAFASDTMGVHHATVSNKFTGPPTKIPVKTAFRHDKVTGSNWPAAFGVNKFYQKDIPARATVKMMAISKPSTVEKDTEEDVESTSRKVILARATVVMNYPHKTHPHAYPNDKVTDGAWPPAFGVNDFYNATKNDSWDTSTTKPANSEQA